MKKKIVTMLLCSIVLCSATACTGSTVKTEKTEISAEDEKPEVRHKINAREMKKEPAKTDLFTTDTSTETESETASVTETHVETIDMSTESTNTETPDMTTDPVSVEGSSETYGKTQVGDVLVNDYVFEQDKSEEYGVFSTSSKDADGFLKDDGTFDRHSLGKTGEICNYDYSGRFAYPEVKTSKRLQNLYLEYRSDISTGYVFDDDGENQGVIGIYLGHDNYQLCSNSDAHVDGVTDYTEFATLKASDGQDVLVYVRDTAAKNKFSVYYYKLGAFSVKVQRNMNDELYTPEELQEIMDNIVLQ